MSNFITSWRRFLIDLRRVPIGRRTFSIFPPYLVYQMLKAELHSGRVYWDVDRVDKSCLSRLSLGYKKTGV